jgi:plasmid stabilization system protein ParE
VEEAPGRELLQGFSLLPRTCGRKDLEGARSVPVTGFAHSLIFYTAAGKSMKVVRVLHAARDFPTVFGE